MTGINDNDLGCLAVKLASFMVDPAEGTLGVGLLDVRKPIWMIRGRVNKRKIVRSKEHEQQMVYMGVEGVDDWLDWQQRQQQHGRLRKYFEWEDYFPVETSDPCLVS